MPGLLAASFAAASRRNSLDSCSIWCCRLVVCISAVYNALQTMDLCQKRLAFAAAMVRFCFGGHMLHEVHPSGLSSQFAKSFEVDLHA